MVHPRIKELTRKMKKHNGATMAELLQFFSLLNFNPPQDYLEFMTETDGAEGSVGNAYLAIYSVPELVERNESTRDLEPGLLFFADDRGGEGYAFQLDVSPSSIIPVEFVDLDPTTAQPLGYTLLEFLEAIQSRAAG